MAFLGKLLAFSLFPIGILIILEQTKLYAPVLPFDKNLIGAILMILTQVVTLIFMQIHTGSIKMGNIIGTILILSPAFYYILSIYVSVPLKETIPLIMGVLMFAEGAYAMG